MILSVIDMPLEQFEGLVADALDGIPVELGEAMENVAVLVDEHRPPGRLLGLYEGVPLTSRGSNYSATGPDRITIFMATICFACRQQTRSRGIPKSQRQATSRTVSDGLRKAQPMKPTSDCVPRKGADGARAVT